MPRKKREPTDEIARRLEAVRKREGCSLAEFVRRLNDHGYDVSYQAAQNYHFDRPPPIDYLVAVSEVFPAANLEYLATGRRETSLPSGLGAFLALNAERHGMARRLTIPLVLNAGPEAVRPVNFVDSLWLLSGDRDLSEDGARAARELLIQGDEILDSLLVAAWDDAKELIGLLCGEGAALERLTLAQQARFAEQIMLAIKGLVPDYGEPPVATNTADREDSDGRT